RVVGPKGKPALLRPCRTGTRDRPCDPVTHRRVIVDRRRVSGEVDDDEAGPDDRRPTAGRDASQAPEIRQRRKTAPSRWRARRHTPAPPARQGPRTLNPPHWPPGAAPATKSRRFR